MADSGLHCSFCGNSQKNAGKLISGPSVYICSECVEICNGIIDKETTREDVEFAGSVILRDGRLDAMMLDEFLRECLAPDRSVDSIAVSEVIDAYHARGLLLRTKERKKAPDIREQIRTLR